MPDRYICSSISKKTIRFKVQIGDYSMYICKGYYASPEFGDDDESENKWSLLVRAYDGADHENFIDVHLKKEDYTSDELFVNVKIWITSCIGINVFKNERKISFRDTNEARILAVAKAQLKGLFGLKKFFYLPNDTLTLQCDLEIVRENNIQEASYQDEASFLSNIPLEVSTSSECFSHSRIVKEDDDFFCWKIQNFAVQTSGGRSVSPEFQSGRLGDKWNLVLYNTHDDDYYGECMDIRLKRRESYEKKLFNAKLSFIDPLGNFLMSEEKSVFFTCPEEKQLLCSTERDFVRRFGLCKKQLLQDDTLTLRCDLLSYKEVDDTFSTKEDFNESIETHGHSPELFMFYLAVPCLLLVDIPYSACLNLLSFIWFTILELIQPMMIFVLAVGLMWFGFEYAKNEGERMLRSYSGMQHIKHWALVCLLSIVAYFFFTPTLLNAVLYVIDVIHIIGTSPVRTLAVLGALAWYIYCQYRENKRKEENRRLRNQRNYDKFYVNNTYNPYHKSITRTFPRNSWGPNVVLLLPVQRKKAQRRK